MLTAVLGLALLVTVTLGSVAYGVVYALCCDDTGVDW